MEITMLRKKYHSIIWKVMWPLRQYILYAPTPRGKGFIKRNLITPFLPPLPESFVAELPGGGKIELQYREVIGLSTLLFGTFEKPELSFITAHVPVKSTVIDIGANVGVFTVTLSSAVGSEGKVMAFEPVATNVNRLKNNLAMNNMKNVEIFPLALGNREGLVDMYLPFDMAYASTGEVFDKQKMCHTITVPMSRLDQIWHQAGKPSVSAMKLDTEGSELEVLQGAIELLSSCRPLLLVEANTSHHLGSIKDWLANLRYVHQHPQGFQSWNHVFTYHGD
jgi:FkbM family methyltransferase